MKSKFFENYIPKLIKTGISINSKQQINSILCCLSKRISSSINSYVRENGYKIINCLHIECIIKIIFLEPLCTKIIENARGAIKSFNANKYIKNKKERAGIIFPPSLCEKFLKRENMRISKDCAIYFASVIETITGVLLKEGEKFSIENKHKIISVRDLELGKTNDPCLSALFSHFSIQFLGGGVVPFIHPLLFNKKSRKKIKSTDEPYRFRPGTVALREIKKLQKTSNCLIFCKDHFEKTVRKYSNKKLSKFFCVSLQHFIEQKLLKFLQEVNELSIHCKRRKILPEDLFFMAKIKDLKIGNEEKND